MFWSWVEKPNPCGKACREMNEPLLVRFPRRIVTPIPLPWMMTGWLMVNGLVAVKVPLGRLIVSLLPLPAAQPFTAALVFTAWIACRMLQQRTAPQKPVGEPVFVVLTVMVVAP